MAGRVGGGRDERSIISDNGHYTDIHGIPAGRDSGHYNILDIDRENDENGDGEDEGAARSRGYEGLDPSNIEPQRSHDYVGLGARDNAASTQQTTEQIEMIAIENDADYQDTVRYHYYDSPLLNRIYITYRPDMPERNTDMPNIDVLTYLFTRMSAIMYAPKLFPFNILWPS